MTKRKSTHRTYEVAYCLEQGFAIEVNAASADDAERIIEERLEDEMDVLAGSRRVHFEGFTANVQEVAHEPL